jgi:hypothetical protein
LPLSVRIGACRSVASSAWQEEADLADLADRITGTVYRTVGLLLMSYLGIAISLWPYVSHATTHCGTQRQSTQAFLGWGHRSCFRSLSPTRHSRTGSFEANYATILATIERVRCKATRHGGSRTIHSGTAVCEDVASQVRAKAVSVHGRSASRRPQRGRWEVRSGPDFWILIQDRETDAVAYALW